jgi:anti-sigma factor RsiW
MINSDALLVAYVDGQLDPEASAKVEALLATDPPAARKVAMFRATATLLRGALNEPFRTGPEIAAALPLRRASPRHRRAVAASLAAAIVVGFCGGATWGGPARSERSVLLDEIAGDHQIYSRETKHLVEVPADQVDRLTAWLGRRIGRTLDVPDLTAAGLHFAGGRMLVFNERPVAELMYTRDLGRPIGLAVAQIVAGNAPINVDQRGGERLASWIKNGYVFVVVGEIDEPTVQNIAQRVAAQASG